MLPRPHAATGFASDDLAAHGTWFVSDVPAMTGSSRGSVLSSLGRLFDKRSVGSRLLPSPLLILLAGIGTFLLLVVATTAWNAPTDEYAYWRAATQFAAGGSMYDPTATPGDASYGYWYPPPLAQVLAPFTSLISSETFSVIWTVLLLGCLWWLGGRDVLVALALIAFLPVAVELRVRNVHLVLAVLVVLALRRSWLFWIPAAAIKVAPVLGVLYLAAARRWKEALAVGIVGGAVLLASVLLAPSAWQDFFSIVLPRAGSSGASILPIPYPVRFAAAAGLALVAGRLSVQGRGPAADALLVCALILANPTLWVTALSLLIALVPLWRNPVGSGPGTSSGFESAAADAPNAAVSRA
jgi:hypothetical protein